MPMLEVMKAAMAHICRGPARSVLEEMEHDMLDMDPSEDRHTVYWFTPEGDDSNTRC
ncbi:hypothetical protein ACOQFL_05630 [Actinopolyspora sp. H202]|uniref:hypothetical protein n=1 Tax=Actinopolyspora sp. H202 TaxID=1500456 RepID=UPI003EE55929